MIDNTVWFIIAIACYFLGQWISKLRQKRRINKNLLREVYFKIIYNPFNEKWMWTSFNPLTRTWEWFIDATEEEVEKHRDISFPADVFNKLGISQERLDAYNKEDNNG